MDDFLGENPLIFGKHPHVLAQLRMICCCDHVAGDEDGIQVTQFSPFFFFGRVSWTLQPAILGVEVLRYITRKHTAYIGEDSSILGTWNVWWNFVFSTAGGSEPFIWWFSCILMGSPKIPQQIHQLSMFVYGKGFVIQNRALSLHIRKNAESFIHSEPPLLENMEKTRVYEHVISKKSPNPRLKQWYITNPYHPWDWYI